jgi:uncharacterized protein YndB with AHSA1/START domain
MPESTRRFETTIEVNATPEEVWKAISEGEGLARWFAPEAKVTPGVGGNVWLSWGEGIAGDARFTIWEPGRRLQTVNETKQPWSPGEVEGAGPWNITVDYHIEARAGGGTVVRLVHAGFGRGSAWDNELDSISNGWKFELRSLKHYLENHWNAAAGGAPRACLYERSVTPLTRPDAWEKLTGPAGLCAEGSVAGLAAGSPYRVRTSAGDLFEGRVLINNPPRTFAATVSNFGNAILRLEVEPGDDKRMPCVWMSVWGAHRDRVPALRDSWRRVLDGLFGPGREKFFSNEQ